MTMLSKILEQNNIFGMTQDKGTFVLDKLSEGLDLKTSSYLPYIFNIKVPFRGLASQMAIKFRIKGPNHTH